MRDDLRAAWCAELTAARRARDADDIVGEWDHLERAHVLSQPMAAPHVRTHLAMLRYGVVHHDVHEIVGQLLRVVVAAPGTLSGRYPVGNTGGAGVRARAPMEVPDDLRPLLVAGTTRSTEG